MGFAGVAGSLGDVAVVVVVGVAVLYCLVTSLQFNSKAFNQSTLGDGKTFAFLECMACVHGVEGETPCVRVYCHALYGFCLRFVELYTDG